MSLSSAATASFIGEGSRVFQPWHSFDSAHAQRWIPASSPPEDSAPSTYGKDTPDLVLATWNIDAGSERAADRANEIISSIISTEPKVDIVFLQEVSREALEQILSDDRIRQSWVSSEGDDSSWGTRMFTSVTLVSKARFASHGEPGKRNHSLGPVWRIKYPSRFARDAIVCDIFLPRSNESPSASPTRPTRLVNVHLDSLPIQPSFRPQQMAIVSSIISDAGSGLVAGDFNPVLEEDASLVEDNGLVDVWKSLHPQEAGYTWGVDGKKRFPPGRLDKVAMLGLLPSSIRVLEPKILSTSNSCTPSSDDTKVRDKVPWSDHHGLLCSFAPVARREA
ncbi:unnamed protein product [Penicillium olsonii]|uniref:Endonuclease/exonuclease/phosphatase domain-containing protein n=1 Tax=Penicillium olsonii TaxID=99116 RepID=A0A9W4HTW6_PENOL|nr:unnamed protein product [Penicillium olsonii]CAG8165224.1 unnamed protein product [Penicillium olsonii]